MSDSKKNDVVETKTIDVARENGRLVSQLRKACDKITRDIVVDNPAELIIRNTEELVAIRAIRDSKQREKLAKTQKMLNKFKSVL